MSAVDDFVQRKFPTVISREFFNLFCGDFIGEGIARKTFAHEIDAALVIKIETAAASFQNVHEWQVWNAIKNFRRASSWFAPCIAISPCGSVLLQKKTQPVACDKLPKRVPAFFNDLKAENWGILNGKVVCHDYGLNTVLIDGIGHRTKKADWSE